MNVCVCVSVGRWVVATLEIVLIVLNIYNYNVCFLDIRALIYLAFASQKNIWSVRLLLLLCWLVM